jgi:NAD(P)-dependent dehydrogenase (short-subunit alcohol dehydrogenase family)
MQGIKDKVVVITGASSGLGEAAARQLARHGAKLVLGARRLERLKVLAEELSLASDAALRTDVTDSKQVKQLVDHAVKSHGRIDVILNNAGLMPQSALELLKIGEWDRMIDVNIKGVLYGIAAALPHMMAQKSGHTSTCLRLPATRSAREVPSMRQPSTPCVRFRKDCDKRSSRTISAPRSSRRERCEPSWQIPSPTRFRPRACASFKRALASPPIRSRI